MVEANLIRTAVFFWLLLPFAVQAQPSLTDALKTVSTGPVYDYVLKPEYGKCPGGWEVHDAPKKALLGSIAYVCISKKPRDEMMMAVWKSMKEFASLNIKIEASDSCDAEKRIVRPSHYPRLDNVDLLLPFGYGPRPTVNFEERDTSKAHIAGVISCVGRELTVTVYRSGPKQFFDRCSWYPFKGKILPPEEVTCGR